MITEQTIELDAVRKAAKELQDVVLSTPLAYNRLYSEMYNANVYLKREDLQLVRSYKIRGAYHKISSLTPEEQQRGIVCVSAGNHAQGVAYACNELGIHGHIFMPHTTPRQKTGQVAMFGGAEIDIVTHGDTFDDAYELALKESQKADKVFIHPFDDEKIIEGQASIGLEIIEQAKEPIDFVFVPVGGGGLASGIASVFSELSPHTKIIGVEPEGAASMKAAFEAEKPVRLQKIDKFVDGAAVQIVSELTYNICRNGLHDIITVPVGHICDTILQLYNKNAIVVEPAGALALAGLEQYAEKLKNKNVVAILSGSNNDILRMAEIKERALLHKGLKHYFIVRFPQRAGALKEFVAEILGPDDDITHFEYSKKHNRENGPAIVGIEIQRKEDLTPLIKRMKAQNFFGEYLNDKPDLFQFLI